MKNDIQKEIIHCIQLAYDHYQRTFTITEYKDIAKEKNLVGYDYALYHSRKTYLTSPFFIANYTTYLNKI